MIKYAEVIGDPIAHSKSPLIHNFWIKKLGLDGEYGKCHVTPDDLEGYLSASTTNPDWRGCNVTLPHKVAIMDLVDDPGDVRGTIGAMNTIIRRGDGTLMGTNTDAAGFFAPISQQDWAGEHAIVIGAGGAARAILFALKQAGIGEVTMLARSQLKAMGLLSSFGLQGQVLAMDAVLPDARLLVNCTSLGMKGQAALEIDLSPLPDDALVYDIVYTPLDTPLLGQARGRNLATVDGMDMLIGQAAMAFELFFGSPPPDDAEEELRQILLA